MEREILRWHVAASQWAIKESRLVNQSTLGKGGSTLVKHAILHYIWQVVPL